MGEDRGRASKAQRRKAPFLGIRVRLIVLALLAIAPLMIERVHQLEMVRAERAERAQAEVVDLARHGIAAQHEIISSVRTLLQMVSSVYSRLPFDAASCSRELTDLSVNIPWIRALSVAATNGQIRCSTEPSVLGLNIADRPHFQHALQSREFALSDYLIGRTRQVPGLFATFPAISEDGALHGVVAAAINLQWINDLAAAAARRQGASVMLLDGNGTLAAGSADQAGFIGKSFAGHPLTKAMLASEEGSTTLAGFDGVRRVFAYARVPWTQARLAVGFDENAVHSGIDREIDVAYLQLALFGMFVLLLAWFAGEQLIVRPIRSLVRTATRFGRGDLQVRASEESWVAEFAPLAAALDDMALKLGEREAELQIANQHLEELASLDGLSGLANRRGFDRGIEREWQRAAAAGEPLALIMVDIDYFKLYNDRYGHVAGDTCLRAVGETLSLVAIEHTAMVARYGGEEFALLLPGFDLMQATVLAEQARKTVEDLAIIHAGSPLGRITVSIGVESMVPQVHQSGADLVEAADCALYDAKRRGRNNVAARAVRLLRVAS